MSKDEEKASTLAEAVTAVLDEVQTRAAQLAAALEIVGPRGAIGTDIGGIIVHGTEAGHFSVGVPQFDRGAYALQEMAALLIAAATHAALKGAWENAEDAPDHEEVDGLQFEEEGIKH